MKKIIALAIAASAFGACTSFQVFIPGAVHAGLGSATQPDIETYSAWCGKKGNDCKVTFEADRLSVDGTDYVLYRDIKAVNYLLQDRRPYFRRHYFEFEYVEQNPDGETEVKRAKIIFGHAKTAKNFWLDVMRTCKYARLSNTTTTGA